jgi:hypothetical protein
MRVLPVSCESEPTFWPGMMRRGALLSFIETAGMQAAGERQDQNPSLFSRRSIV